MEKIEQRDAGRDPGARPRGRNRRERLVALLLLLLVVVVVKQGQELVRSYVHADELRRLEALSDSLEEVALEVVRSQMRADSLREVVTQLDGTLGRSQRAIAAYDRHSAGGALPSHLYAAYRDDVDEYNRQVAQRNTHFEQWQQAVERNHRSVDRYNALADSIGSLAARIGEPYYPIPRPLEVAVERGLIPDSRLRATGAGDEGPGAADP